MDVSRSRPKSQGAKSSVEESKTDGVDDLRAEIDEYLVTSEEYADEMRAMEQNAAVRAAGGDAVEREAPRESLLFSQCLCVGLLAVSLAVFGVLMFHFFALAAHSADRIAYYRYLHSALEIRRRALENGTNTSIPSACRAAIHKEDIAVLYESASVHLSHLDLDLEGVTETDDGPKGPAERVSAADHKKRQLIAMCDVEIQIMSNKIKRERSERQRIALFHRTRRAREDGWAALMENADRIRNGTAKHSAFNATESIAACDVALRNETVLAFYGEARYPMDTLRNRSKVQPHFVHRHDLNPREELIISCAVHLVMLDVIRHSETGHRASAAAMEKAVGDDIRITAQHQRADSASDAETVPG